LYVFALLLIITFDSYIPDSKVKYSFGDIYQGIFFPRFIHSLQTCNNGNHDNEKSYKENRPETKSRIQPIKMFMMKKF